MRFSSNAVNYFFLYHMFGCPVNINGVDPPSTLPPTSTRKADTLTPKSSPNRGSRPRHNQDNSGISGDGSGGSTGDRNNSGDCAGGGNGSDNNGGNGSDDNNNDEPLDMDNDESAVGK